MKKSKRICAALAAMMMGLTGSAMGLELPDDILIEDGEPVLCSTAASAYLTEVLIEEKGLTLGESSLAYPALKEGAAAEELRETVNERILEDGRIRIYTERMSRLISGGKLRVTWQGDVLGPVFSFGISAEGAVETPRNTHAWTGGRARNRPGRDLHGSGGGPGGHGGLSGGGSFAGAERASAEQLPDPAAGAFPDYGPGDHLDV